MNKKKFVNGIYYSTDLNSKCENLASEEKLIDFSQKVFITLNKSKNNKLITSISNIDSNFDDLNRFAKIIKTKCGTGGTIKDGDILIQGDFIEKVYNIIKELGFDNIKK